MVLKGLYFIMFDHSRYERLAGVGSSEFAKPFRKHVVQSLVGSGLAIALAIAVATLAGRIEWSGPVAWNKVFTTIGGFFGAWGTWFGVTERASPTRSRAWMSASAISCSLRCLSRA